MLHHLPQPTAPPSKREQMVQDLTRAPSGDEEMGPFHIAPEVEQQKSQGDKEEAQFSRPGSGPGAHSVHQAIAGLNTEAATILVSYLTRSQVDLDDDNVSKAIQPPAAKTAFTVDADDMNGKGFLIISGTLAGIGSVEALAPTNKARVPPVLPRMTKGIMVGKGCCFR